MINWKILENPIFQTKPIDFFQFVKPNNMDPRKSSSSEPKCRPPRSRTHDHCVILGTFASSASALGVRSSALGVRSLILAGEQLCRDWGHGSREWGHGKQWGQMNSNDPTNFRIFWWPVGLIGDTTCAISEFHSRNRSQRIESSILPGQRNTETSSCKRLFHVVPQAAQATFEGGVRKWLPLLAHSSLEARPDCPQRDHPPSFGAGLTRC